jgi:hypothetical protein
VEVKKAVSGADVLCLKSSRVFRRGGDRAASGHVYFSTLFMRLPKTAWKYVISILCPAP